MSIPHKPIGTVAEMLQLIDLDVTQQHEDMVFVSRNLFILRFTKDAEIFDIYFNEAIEEQKAQVLMGQLESIGELHGLVIRYKGAYIFNENEDETVSIEFFDLTDG